MDARVCARPGCGNPLLPGRNLEDFCTYACQGQFRALQATSGPSGLVGAKNTKQNKELPQTALRRSFLLRQDQPRHLPARSSRQIECGLVDGSRLARGRKAAMDCTSGQSGKRAVAAR
jgi:hypothetical protein